MGNWDRTSEAAANAGAAAAQFVEAMREFFAAACADISENIIEPVAACINQYAEENAALRWAETCRPEWVRIHDRTKKKRTRKKYRDRIMRAYREEAQRNG